LIYDTVKIDRREYNTAPRNWCLLFHDLTVTSENIVSISLWDWMQGNLLCSRAELYTSTSTSTSTSTGTTIHLINPTVRSIEGITILIEAVIEDIRMVPRELFGEHAIVKVSKYYL
jgi:hypothetical protein